MNTLFKNKNKMAKRMATFILLALLVFTIFPQNQASHPNPGDENYLYGATEGSLRPQDCAPKCTGRCSGTAYKKPCLSFCNKCCATCLCVPPGTYGNKQFCPCYNNWKTKRGGPKCP